MRNPWLSLKRGWPALLGLVALGMVSCGDEKPPQPPTKFRVGGKVTGLVGSLTLQLNGAETLTRAENGPFSFEGQLDDQSTFTVELKDAPAEQECTLQGASGHVHGADVDSVQVSCAQRLYTLGGTAEGIDTPLQLHLNDGETFSLTANGPFTFSTKLPKGGTYSVTLGTQPAARRCTVTNGSGTVAGNVTSLTVQCSPWYRFTSFQAATRIIGQSTPTGSAPDRGGTPGQDTLSGPWGNPTLAGGKLYISDQGNNRILGFNGLPTQSIAPAEFVLGQTNFTNNAQNAGRTGINFPAGTASDGTWLAIADKGNNRVLLYQHLPTSTGAAPDLVLGHTDFTDTSSRCDKSGFNAPETAFIDHGKVIVADTFNNRVLIWNTLPAASGAAPDLVLGQASFTSCAGNDKNADGTLDADRAPNASTLWLPQGVWTDGTRLLVSDSNNDRVLLWNQFPTQSGQPADIVLGQPDFSHRAADTTQTTLNAPTFLTSTGIQIFVADTSNNRILVWDKFPTQNNPAADAVLGQQDFTSMDQYDPSSGTDPSARSLSSPAGVLLTGPYVVVTDRGNNRLVVYESP